MDMKEADRRALKAMFTPAEICEYPGCLKRARGAHTHPNKQVKSYCSEHLQLMRTNKM